MYAMKATLNTATTTTTMFMAIRKIAKQGLTHPFGDHRTVKQAFPSGIPSVESDPFLMCDYFDMKETTGPVKDEDDFPVGWHPHRGFDIASYLKSGTGRHGDSLGNRETFETPGMQWMSVGSGVEHAEGGASEKGVFVQGFQIWVNVPAARKMDDPRYGTVPSKDLPLVPISDTVQARVLAGEFRNGDTMIHGPFQTVQPVQMVDLELEPNGSVSFDVQSGLDTAMLYVYEGSLASVNDQEATDVQAGSIILMDATSSERRGVELISSADNKASVMLFAGEKLKAPIAWRGPIVMNTDEQIHDTFMELRMGNFPPKRVPWDYKRAAARPIQEEEKEL